MNKSLNLRELIHGKLGGFGMRKRLICFGSWLILRLLSLRYKIEVKGMAQLCLKKRGILFLPNHPAEIDPIIISGLLAPKFDLRPIVNTHFYYMHGARFFMHLLRAVPIPDFDISVNSWKLSQVEQCFNQVKEGAQRGENFLIYPSGRLKRDGDETIGGSSLVHRILQATPDIQVVLIRSTGLWGSVFSRAIEGKTPDFWRVFAQGIRVIFKNGIFFTPRRKVTIEFEVAEKAFPSRGSRREINQYLEKWYNHYLVDKEKRKISEPLALVSLSFFPKKFPRVIKQDDQKKKKEDLNVPDLIRTDVYREIKKVSGATEIRDNMDLSKDLGLDSLDIASLHAFIDKRYDIPFATPEQLQTVYDLLELTVKESMTQPELDRGRFIPI